MWLSSTINHKKKHNNTPYPLHIYNIKKEYYIKKEITEKFDLQNFNFNGD